MSMSTNKLLVWCSFWATVLVALNGILTVTAQSTATFHLFTSAACQGNHLSCSGIPITACCSSSTGEIFASSLLDSSLRDASIQVHSHPRCTGVQRTGATQECIEPTFAFVSVGGTLSRKREDSDTSPDEDSPADCYNPDSATIVNDDGSTTVIKIPDGKNVEFEQAFAQGDFAKLFKLADTAL